MFFEYGSRETEYLKSRDKLLAQAIEKIGHIEREVDHDIFAAVVHHIIGQQISTAVQETIWKRLCKEVGEVHAETIVQLDRDTLQALGMTYRKADYIKEFADKVCSGLFDINALYQLSDENVVKSLSSLRGIGAWTAEMIMIFCMQRPNIVSYGDLAIHRGMRMLYHHRKIDKERFSRYARRYAPYGTVASLYLWEIAGGAILEMKDYAPKKKR